jgi:hypothetical protein
MINVTGRAAHVFPVLVGKELIDCRAKAQIIGLDWMSLILDFKWYF